MDTFLMGAVICTVLMLISTALFYEIMAHIWLSLPRLRGKRSQILITMFGTFFAHTLVVWLFGAVFYLLDTEFHFGNLKGADEKNFFQYVYFSGVSYSSLGFGDIDATGGLQLITVVEAILGLTFIGWSVAFTYIVMQEYLLHKGGGKHPLAKKL
jgi:bacteriorhodopsin